MAPKKNERPMDDNEKPKKIPGSLSPLNQPLFPFTVSNPHLVTLGSSVRLGGTGLGTVADPKLLNLTVGSGVTDILAKKSNLITYDPKLLSDVVVSPGHTLYSPISGVLPTFQNSVLDISPNITTTNVNFLAQQATIHTPHNLTTLNFPGVLSTIGTPSSVLTSTPFSFDENWGFTLGGKPLQDVPKKDLEAEMKKLQDDLRIVTETLKKAQHDGARANDRADKLEEELRAKQSIYDQVEAFVASRPSARQASPNTKENAIFDGFLIIRDFQLDRRKGTFTRTATGKKTRGNLRGQQLQLFLKIEECLKEGHEEVPVSLIKKVMGYSKKDRAGAFSTLLSKAAAAIDDKEHAIIRNGNNYNTMSSPKTLFFGDSDDGK